MLRLRLLATALFVLVQVGASICQDASTVRLSEVFPSITRIHDYFPGGVIPQDVIPLDVLNVSAPCMMALAAIPTGMKATPPWGLQMLDASSKPWSGILDGNIVELGNFDECVAVRAITNLTSPFQGKHCLATISMGMKKEIPPAKTIWEALGWQMEAAKMLQAAKADPKLREGGGVILAVKGLRMSFCVPSTCSAKDVQDGLNSALSYMNVTFVKLAVTDADCITDEGPSLRTKDWIAIVILCIFGVTLITSTTYDLATGNTDGRRPLLLAFSVYSNGKRLLSTSSGGRDNLPALHGIRFLSLAWVILGHAYSCCLSTIAINTTTYIPSFFTDWKRMYILNGTVSVDTFFLLSGLLVSYVFLNQMSKKGARFNIFLYYVHRYIRLTPALAIMIMLSATVLRHLGSGPLWNSNLQVTEELCNEYWWSTLLYVQNYVNPGNLCVAQSWYLAVDMQLFLLSPFVLIPLWKRPKIGVIWLVLLIFTGIASAFTVAYINKFLPVPMAFLHGIDQETISKKMYQPTHTRFSPWLIGVALGYVLHILRGKELRLPKWAVALGWALAALSSIGSFVGIYPYLQEDFVYNRVGDSLYDATFRSLWVLGVAWVIFACTKGYGGPVNTILSWNVWQPLSRLSYTMYLTHAQYQVSEISSMRTPVYLGDAHVIPMFFGDTVIAAGFAVCLSLACESPAIILEKVLLTPGDGQEKKQIDASVTQNELSTNLSVDKEPV